MTTVDTQTVTNPTELAERWLAKFDRALGRGDPSAAATLLEQDGIWRDILAFTWDLHTFEGSEQVEAALTESLATTKPKRFQVDYQTPPRYVERAGVEAIEAIFEFDTVVGRGRGVVRLVHDEIDQGDLRAWTLLTSLQELSGFEDHTGERRPRGGLYSNNFGGPNWLDQRTAARQYEDADPDVIIVGGGQAGLGLAARLGQLDVDTLIVDRAQRVGDNWRNRYHSLALHNEVWVTHLPYLPFPPTWPVYVPKDKLANWFEAYVESMEINFWTGTEFVKGEYNSGEQRWSVVLRNLDGTERIMHPKHVVMATGVSGIPNVPAVPGCNIVSAVRRGRRLRTVTS